MSSTAWDLQALRLHFQKPEVRQVAGEDTARRVVALVNSISRAVQIFRYHMLAARDAMKGILDEADAEDTEPLLLVFGGGSKQDEFAYARVVSEANLVSCLQTARNLWDITAQLLNATVNPSPMPEERCHLFRLRDALPPMPLKDFVEALSESGDFRYVNAFVNVTKHRRLVDHGFSVSFVENRIGMRVSAFHYDGANYPQKWGNDALQAAVNVKNQVIAAGRLLNSTLRA